MPTASPREGFRVIMPDLRAHGDSGKPHDPANYPPDVLVRDLEELIAHLGLDEFDLGGFSLGSRTTIEAVGEGLQPRRAILGGTGLEVLTNWKRRKQLLRRRDRPCSTTRQRGDPHWLSIQFMKTMKVDRVAAALLLQELRRCIRSATCARRLHHADAGRVRERGRGQWLGAGARGGAAQRDAIAEFRART